MKKELEMLISKLKDKDPESIRTLIGFDGFVDEVVHIVDTRYDTQRYDRLNTLKDFGQKIIDASGVSRNFEFVTVQKKLGGNGPNMAHSLISCGCSVTYIGALGKPDIDPVFHDFSKSARVVSISEPGHTQAIEFFDGKLICSNLDTLNAVDPENLKAAIAPKDLARWIAECNFIGFENWTLVMNMTKLWKYLLDEVLVHMDQVLPFSAESRTRKPLFIDLADPEKRSSQDIQEALDVLSRFEQYFDVILGLNRKEAMEIASLPGFCSEDQIPDDPAQLADLIRNKLNINTVVVHTLKHAYAADPEQSAAVDGPYCPKPILTTGAGDNFNAGFMLGRALQLEEKECLYLGCANSGFYVRNGKSADFEELKSFIDDWKDQRLDSNVKEE